ncbi:PH domain-containing protein [Aeromicrobium sp. Leaf350]|uniref:PH domain-containing protein n=1 Tax=Aeromicrobium sp. Leaf350 TaxID=2876565 RepID=UPI001E3A366C|nr:PH domain-containing protein [Aeromicrobium sp. Leaf350]
MTTDDRLVVRPQGPRIVAYGVAVLMIVCIVAIGRALPDYVYFSLSEKITMWILLLAVLALLHGVGRSSVKADAEGIDVLNGYRRHHLTWDQVEGISMKSGAPWATLVTKDDDRVILFAIQSSDGDGREVITQLRAWAA